MSFSQEMRRTTDVYWEASFEHPFVKGLVEGTLPLENFQYYMLQDAYYLKHYAKIMAIAAVKGTTNEEIGYFLARAKNVYEAELDLHRTVFQELHITEEQVENFEVAPAAYNYVSHMYNAAHNGDLAEIFAATLPCPWLYQEIGEKYKDAKPGVKVYEDWLALYSSTAFKEDVEEQVRWMDGYAKEHRAKEQLLRDHFEKACYYEWKFWEMAWHKESWRDEVKQYAVK